MSKKVLVVVITYNIGNLISRCLDSLNKQTYQNYELIIIDNNSSDSTLQDVNEYLKSNISIRKRTRIIKNKSNVGFAKAVNIGLKIALSSDVYAVLLLNQDVYFTHDLLENGIKVLIKNADAGAVESKILYPDNKIWWIGTRIFSNKELLFSPTYGIAEHINKGEFLKLKKNEESEVEALTGCAPFLRVEAIKKVGLFNEKYFMYAEDIDYSIRLVRQGYKLLLFTGSTVFHDVNDDKMTLSVVRSSFKKYKIYLRSISFFLLEYKPKYFFVFWIIKLLYALPLNYLWRRE